MDLGGIIVITIGMVLFFGGAAWMEIRSRSTRRTAWEEWRSSERADLAPPAGRAAYRRRPGE